MNTNYIAHIRKPDKQPQPLQTHLTETATIAQALASKLGLGSAGELLGLMHDFGKKPKISKSISKSYPILTPMRMIMFCPMAKKLTIPPLVRNGFIVN